MCCSLKKAFTLLEVTITISLVILLFSSCAFLYKYYISFSKDRIVSFYSEQIFEAVICLYQEQEGNLDAMKLVQGVKDLINLDITVTSMNTDEKLFTLGFTSEGKYYWIKIDIKNRAFTVTDIVGDRIIYEN